MLEQRHLLLLESKNLTDFYICYYFLCLTISVLIVFSSIDQNVKHLLLSSLLFYKEYDISFVSGRYSCILEE